MRTMPSVTDTMVPTLRASVTDLKSWMRSWISSLISVALIAISLLFRSNSLSGQLVRQALEARAQRAVNHEITGAQHRTADEVLVHVVVQPHLAVEFLGERRGELALLGLIQRLRGCHRDVGDAEGGVLECVEARRYLRQVPEAAVVRQRAHEVLRFLAREADAAGVLDDADHQLRQLLRGDVRAAEQSGDPRILHGAGSD